MKKIFLSIIALGFLASCSQNLDQSPTNVFPTEDLSKVDPSEVAAPVLSSAVLRMHTMGSGTDGTSYKVLHLAMDLKGNDMLQPLAGGGGWFRTDYQMEHYRGRTDGRAVNYWGLLYRSIFQANQAMEFIDLNTAKDLAASKLILAQGKTYRAFNYYHLLCIYQDAYTQGGKDKPGIPYYTKSDAAATGRSTLGAVCDSVMRDVTEAIALFKESGKAVTNKEQVSIYVAYMVQARLALMMGQYEIAKTAAAEVIKGFTLMSKSQAMDNGFQDLSNPETIWGYMWMQNTSLSNNSFSSHISTNVYSGYGGSQGGWKIIDERLYNKISATDWRKELFYATDTELPYNGSPATVKALSNKKFNAPTFNNDEVYMRVAEAYFIKAEAEARSSGDAAGTLYSIVSTRDASYTKSTASGQALIDEILLHKRIEMWGEGLEFFDNKRIGKGVDRASSNNHEVKKVVPAGVDFTFQIPRSEISLNPEISEDDQNP